MTLPALVACAVAGMSATRAPPIKANTAVDPSANSSSTARAVSPITGTARAKDAVAQPDASGPVATATVMPDVDYWATPQPVVDKMLELARVKASDVVYDLGCGDARSLVTAAERYGANGVGFDIDPRLVAEARENVRRHGVEHLVKIEQADIFTLDLSPADVIFLYITPRFNLRLVPQFEKMKPGSRIVSHEFEIPGARPARIVHVKGPADGPPDADRESSTVMHKIYLWKLPWQKQWTDWKTP